MKLKELKKKKLKRTQTWFWESQARSSCQTENQIRLGQKSSFPLGFLIMLINKSHEILGEKTNWNEFKTSTF